LTTEISTPSPSVLSMKTSALMEVQPLPRVLFALCGKE
jgi:hypothetical protein